FILPLHMQTNLLADTSGINKSLSFDNTEIAFQSKSDADLNRVYWLFKLLSSNLLVRIGSPITNLALNIGLPIENIIKKTVFLQFCGGQTIEGCDPAVKHLASYNIRTILDYSVEGKET